MIVSSLLDGLIKMHELEDSSVEPKDTPMFLNTFDVEMSVLKPSEAVWSSNLEFKNGGCFGIRTSKFELLNMQTTWAMDGLRQAEACVHSNPIWNTLDTSVVGKSTASANLFDW